MSSELCCHVSGVQCTAQSVYRSVGQGVQHVRICQKPSYCYYYEWCHRIAVALHHMREALHWGVPQDLKPRQGVSDVQAFPHRTDGKLYRIMTPQSPVARTKRYDAYCMDEHPNGTNMVVAVLAYTCAPLCLACTLVPHNG